MMTDISLKSVIYTSGTKGWSRLRDRTLAVPKKRAKISFFLLKKLPYVQIVAGQRPVICLSFVNIEEMNRHIKN